MSVRTAPISRRTFLAAGATLPLASACRSSSRGETVEFWAMGREAEVVADLLPDIPIDVQQLAWTAAHQKLLTAFAGDALPDVCQLGNTWIPELVALGALEPLDPLLAASAEIRREDYFPGIWDTNVVGGSLYGIPWYVDTRLLFYRRDLLAEAGYDAPPKTWAEWSQMLAAVKRLVGPRRYAVLLPLNEFEPLLALALQHEEPLLRDNGRWGNFRSESFRRTLRFYVEMFRQDWAPAVTNTEISNVWHEFGRGYFSFYISGPWNIREFRRRLPAELQDAWMTAPLPGPDGPGASSAGGSSLVICRASHRKQAAWQLIEHLSQRSVQARFHGITGNPPPRRSVWDSSQLASDAYARAFRQQLERAKPVPKVAEWERIMDEMRLVAERAVDGGLSIDAAVELLDARVDRILEKRRWMLDRGALV
ncbi:MAG: sugar ABC transporter substrate-binding protein [Steroidobacteraceae bacterium]